MNHSDAIEKEKGRKILCEMIAAATMSVAASFYKFRADSTRNLSLISAHGAQRGQTQSE